MKSEEERLEEYQTEGTQYQLHLGTVLRKLGMVGLERTYSEFPGKRGQLSQAWMRRAWQCQLNARSQGSNCVYFWKLLFPELHIGQTDESNVKIKISLDRWVFRKPTSLLCTIIKEVFHLKNKNESPKKKRRKEDLATSGPHPGCFRLEW